MATDRQFSYRSDAEERTDRRQTAGYTVRSSSEQGRVVMNHYVSLVALSLLSLQAAALDLAKHPQVFEPARA
jgi:hypothetical protein